MQREQSAKIQKCDGFLKMLHNLMCAVCCVVAATAAAVD